jgi:hypothetical protein
MLTLSQGPNMPTSLEIAAQLRAMADQISSEPTTGSWIRADEVDAMALQLDAAMNGAAAAQHPALSDVVLQAVQRLKTTPAPVVADAGLQSQLMACHSLIAGAASSLEDVLCSVWDAVQNPPAGLADALANARNRAQHLRQELEKSVYESFPAAIISLPGIDDSAD